MRIPVIIAMLLSPVSYAQLLTPVEQQAVLVQVDQAGLTLNGQLLPEGSVFDGTASVKAAGKAQILCIEADRKTRLVNLEKQTQVACGENHRPPDPFSLESIPDRAGPNACSEIALIDTPDTNNPNATQDKNSLTPLLESATPSLRWSNPGKIKLRIAVNAADGTQVLKPTELFGSEIQLGPLESKTKYKLTLQWTGAQGEKCTKSGEFRLAAQSDTAEKTVFENNLRTLPEPIQVSVLSGYYVSNGYFAKAWDLLTKNQTRGYLKLALGDLYQMIGLPNEAKRIYGNVIKTISGNPLLLARAQWSLGKLLISKGRGPELSTAIDALSAALQTLQAFNLDVQADAQASLGYGQYLKSKIVTKDEKTRWLLESTQSLTQAIQQVQTQKRDVPPGWYEHLGQVYEEQEKIPDARAAYQAALEGYRVRNDTRAVKRIESILKRVSSP
jgi:tetratricopeptide (TPR) repeat protein